MKALSKKYQFWFLSYNEWGMSSILRYNKNFRFSASDFSEATAESMNIPINCSLSGLKFLTILWSKEKVWDWQDKDLASNFSYVSSSLITLVYRIMRNFHEESPRPKWFVWLEKAKGRTTAIPILSSHRNWLWLSFSYFLSNEGYSFLNACKASTSRFNKRWESCTLVPHPAKSPLAGELLHHQPQVSSWTWTVLVIHSPVCPLSPLCYWVSRKLTPLEGSLEPKSLITWPHSKNKYSGQLPHLAPAAPALCICYCPLWSSLISLLLWPPHSLQHSKRKLMSWLRGDVQKLAVTFDLGGDPRLPGANSSHLPGPLTSFLFNPAGPSHLLQSWEGDVASNCPLTPPTHDITLPLYRHTQDNWKSQSLNLS